MSPVTKLLIIKHGALGDIFKSLGAFRILRKAFPKTTLHVLTTKPFMEVFHQTGYVDEVMIDPRAHNPFVVMNELGKIHQQHYSHILDLQNSGRTQRMYYLLRYIWRDQALWIGNVNNGFQAFTLQQKRTIPILSRLKLLLAALGVLTTEEDLLPSLEWVPPLAHVFELPSSYALLMPGSSTVGGSLQKRWPGAQYTQVAQFLQQQGVTPVIMGGESEAALGRWIAGACVGSIDLTGKTSVLDIAGLAKGASIIIGNDTGPLYIAAAAGKPTHVLWSGFSDPSIHAPVGGHIRVHHASNLAELPADQVINCLKEDLNATHL